jgi:hypothetical protein
MALPRNATNKSIPASLRARKPNQKTPPKFVFGGGAGPGEGILAEQVQGAMKFLFGDPKKIKTNVGGVNREVGIAESATIGSLIGAGGRKLAADAAKGIAAKEAKNAAALTKPRTVKPAKPAEPATPVFKFNVPPGAARGPGTIGDKSAASATAAANATRKNFLKAGYSKEIADAAAVRNGAQYERGMVGVSVTPIKPAPKVAATGAKAAAPAGKLSKAEAREMELAEINKLMKPNPRPARTTSTESKGAKPSTTNRRTPAEAAAIRKGKQTAKTPEMSAKLDAADAKATASSPAKFGRDSDIELRTTKVGDEQMATRAEVSKFQAARGKVQGSKKTRRTAEERKRYKDDLQNTLNIGARMRAEGRTPGLDVGGAGSGAPSLGSKAPASVPKATPKEAIRETAADGLRKPIKPRNPGRAGSEAKQLRYKEGMAKYEKDLAAWEKRTAGMASKTKAIDEGRLKPDGTPKGATAKSIARNQRNLAKKAGAEGPKKPAASAATKPSSALVRVPTTRGQKAGGPQVKGGRVIPLAPKRGQEIEVIRGKVLATRPSATPARPVKRRGLLKKGLGGMAGVGAVVGAAGYTFQKSGAGKTKPSTANQGSEGTKRRVLTDKYGRQIGRAEYNKREKFRASIVGKTPAQVAKLRKVEAKRREEFRNTDGKNMFGVLASRKTKNTSVPVGVSVRKKPKYQFRATPKQIAAAERFK